jgi:hypothetical protein
MTTNDAEDPLLNDVLRLRRLVQWCHERGLDPCAVIEGRVEVDLPTDLWPGCGPPTADRPHDEDTAEPGG